MTSGRQVAAARQRSALHRLDDVVDEPVVGSAQLVAAAQLVEREPANRVEQAVAGLRSAGVDARRARR